MRATDVFPSKYLKKEDITRPTTFTIDEVVMEDVSTDDGKDRKAVMHFKGDQSKPMILNRGNWSVLEEAYGEDSDSWSGHPVEVYVDPSVMFAGKRVGGVRVRVPDQEKAPVVWTMEQALALAAQASITKETVIANLKALGINGWNSEKCTPLVKDMIAKANETPF